MGKDEPGPRAGPGREEPGQLGSPGAPLIRQRLRSFHEERARLHQVTKSEVRLGEPILRFDLETRVSKLGGNVERLPVRFECAGVVADVPQPSAEIGQDNSEPASVADLRRDGLSLAHELQDSAIVAEGRQGRP